MSKILITRPMPKAVEDRARSMGDVTFRKETTPMSATEMVSALHEFDVVLPTLGDQFSAQIFDQVDAPRVRLLANFGVGYNHIDVVAAKSKGIMVTNTPGAVTDATADIAMS
jgi:lactate dehydrogenase-like 2-hydroxyacid dehydrogenase